MEKMRIQKYLSLCGVMSRRKAEEEIAGGKVLINGVPAVIGQPVDPDGDAVQYNGRLCEICDKKVYIKLYKPRGYVVTLSDEKGRKCVTELLDGVTERVYPIGRLDLDSEGLLLLTNDGETANALMHPSGGLEKVYFVKTRTFPTEEQLLKLNSPMEIDGYKLRPVRVTVNRGAAVGASAQDQQGASLKFVLREGRNRQIRKMCDKVGLEVARLTRVSVGSINLSGLRSGQWAYLTRDEINYLKDVCRRAEKKTESRRG